MMLTEKQIRQIALLHIKIGEEHSSNRGFRDHTDGLLRGLIWALTGDDPGTHLTEDIKHVMDLLGIPAMTRGNRVEYDETVVLK